MTDRLFLPALRGRIGDWVYYVAVVKLSDVKDRIHLATEIHTSATLNEFIQRRVTKRSEYIKDYILEQPQRFLNSLVVGVYGGSPDFYELRIGENPTLGIEELPEALDGAVGILRLEGGERLFALDGQHRLAGIRKALDERPHLGDETVSAIFVGHGQDVEGMTRTRRLFTTLNRYAKPISALDKIAMDEDDIVAIVTRRLVDNYPLFEGRIPSTQAKPIPVGDQVSITTLASLYASLDLHLRPQGASSVAWAKRKRLRPSDMEIDTAYAAAVDLFDALTSVFEPLRLLSEGQPTNLVIPRFRNREEGGHLILRPIGLDLVVRVIRAFTEQGLTVQQAAERLGAVPMMLNAEPWLGLLWDPSARRVNSRRENQQIARWLLLYGAGGDVGWLGKSVTIDRVRRELMGVLFPEDPNHELIDLKRFVQPVTR
jgi:DNA sulfur modification protein DndB